MASEHQEPLYIMVAEKKGDPRKGWAAVPSSRTLPQLPNFLLLGPIS